MKEHPTKMKRLPIKFEKEVLESHNILWYENGDKLDGGYYYPLGYLVQKYGLAGIALESLGKCNGAYLSINDNNGSYESKRDHLNGLRNISYYETDQINIDIDENKPLFEIQVYKNNPNGFITVLSQDFCDCVFKAIMEIYYD
jgi:hypothetical protein